MRKVDILVIGGGVAGLSTAYFLAEAGQRSVCVLEQEKELGGHASGRNAGMLRQALSDPTLAGLAVQSRKFFDCAEKKGWRGLDLRKNGSLLVSMREDAQELWQIEKTILRLGLKPRRLLKGTAIKKTPLLKGGRFDEALFCPSDAMVDIQSLLRGFLRNLKRYGVSVVRGRPLQTVRTVEGGFVVQCGNEKWFSKKIVNAAGAWAGWLAQKAGGTAVPLVAYRRHLYFTPQDSVRRASWPFVWDLSHDFYFRPYGRRLMLSPCDRTPEAYGDRREKVDPAMEKRLMEKLKEFSAETSCLRIAEAKSGLRTMAPDGRFVVGQDPALKGFYWVAGLGGHGVTTCFSVGKISADIILGKKVDESLRRALSPGRMSLRAPKGRSNLIAEIASSPTAPRNDGSRGSSYATQS